MKISQNGFINDQALKVCQMNAWALGVYQNGCMSLGVCQNGCMSLGSVPKWMHEPWSVPKWMHEPWECAKMDAWALGVCQNGCTSLGSVPKWMQEPRSGKPRKGYLPEQSGSHAIESAGRSGLMSALASWSSPSWPVMEQGNCSVQYTFVARCQLHLFPVLYLRSQDWTFDPGHPYVHTVSVLVPYEQEGP